MSPHDGPLPVERTSNMRLGDRARRSAGPSLGSAASPARPATQEGVMANPVLDTARHLAAAGVSTIPIRADGSKAPASQRLPIDAQTLKPSWKPYQRRIADDHELVHGFAPPVGIAIVAGAVSGHLEILDFDDPTTLGPWGDLVDAAAPGLIVRLVIVQTPSG